MFQDFGTSSSMELHEILGNIAFLNFPDINISIEYQGIFRTWTFPISLKSAVPWNFVEPFANL